MVAFLKNTGSAWVSIIQFAVRFGLGSDLGNPAGECTDLCLFEHKTISSRNHGC